MQGMGADVMQEFLKDVPNLSRYNIVQALQNLKSSGDYARII